MSSDRERVLELLDRWSELSDAGREVSATELCVDCPELIDELTAQMRFLRRLDGLVVPAADPGETALPQEAAESGETVPPQVSDRTPVEAGLLPPLCSFGGFPAIPNHEILGELGGGGMGTVYKARNLRLGRVVALKVIRDGLAGPAYLDRFRREAAALARLNHPNVVQVYEVGDWRPAGGGPELPYLSMEFVEGGDLEGRIGREPANPAEAARLLRLLARAVAALHKAGILHRDLKLGNALLAPPADEAGLNCAWGCPKLADLGLARALEGDGSSLAGGSVVGTPGYMAPEQAEGSPDVGPPADVYGLGAVLYRLLTGRPPIRGDSPAQVMARVLTEVPTPPREVNPAVPPALDALCVRCLAKDPAVRPTVPEVIETLDAYLAAGAATTAELPRAAAVVAQEGLPAAPRVWGRSALVASALAGLLVLVGVVIWLAGPGSKKTVGGGADGEGEADGAGDHAGAAPLKFSPLRATHYARTADGKGAKNQGEIGVESFSTRFGDQVSIRVELSRPAHLYLLAFNANGKEQLLWPCDEANKPQPSAAPTEAASLRFPLAGKRITLNDEAHGGLQVFVALASSRPLPPYEEWKKGRGGVGWKRHEAGAGVWQADDKGVYEVVAGKGADRATIDRPAGAPPLEALCERLRVGGVEAVEAVAFGVRAKGGER